MIDELTGGIKYDGFKKAGFISECKAKVVLRARKKIFDCFMKVECPEQRTKVLDAGVAPCKGIKGVKTVTNNFFEKFYPYKNSITATSIEDAHNIESAFPGIYFVQTKPYETPFRDREFDVVFCNAVVEHTGDREHQKLFIQEYCRVAKKFFFTTPNRWFPIEPHSALPLVHYLPGRMFRKILKLCGKKALADINILNLLSAKEFLLLFPENTRLSLIKIRTFGMTSNLIIYGEWEEE